MARSQPGDVGDDRERNLQLQEDNSRTCQVVAAAPELSSSQPPVGTGADHNGVLSIRVRDDERNAGRNHWVSEQASDIHARSTQIRSQALGKTLPADFANEDGGSAETRRRHRLVGPFAAGEDPKAGVGNCFAGMRQARRLQDKIRVDATYDSDGPRLHALRAESASRRQPRDVEGSHGQRVRKVSSSPLVRPETRPSCRAR